MSASPDPAPPPVADDRVLGGEPVPGGDPSGGATTSRTSEGPRHAGLRRRRAVTVVLPIFLVLCAGLGGAGVGMAARGGSPMAALRGFGDGAAGRPPGLPLDAAARPLARPAEPPTGVGGYRPMNLQDDGSGEPVRWDPCRPVHYVVRTTGAPPGGAAAVRQAISEVSLATGLQFVSDGTTDERPEAARPLMDTDRYGSGWSPVLVAWTDPAEYPDMQGYAGLGGPALAGGREPGARRYVSGVVLLNATYLERVAGEPDGTDRMLAVVRHEFGHLAGLDHVEDPAELMFSRPGVAGSDFSAGDRRGLAALGGGPCFRDF